MNAAALRDLGFKDDEKVGELPAFDQVMQKIGLPALIKFGRRAEQGMHDNLVVYPSIQQVGLMGTRDEPGYIPRFDRKQGGGTKTSVTKDVWSSFDDTDAAHDPHSEEEGWVVAMVLDAGSDLAEGPFGGPEVPRGLFYTGLDVHDQRAILETDQEDSDLGEHLILSSITLPQIVLINAQRRLQGHQLMDDTHSFVRLPHYPDVPVSGISQTPSVGTIGDQLTLGYSETNQAFPAGGIREAAQVVPIAETE